MSYDSARANSYSKGGFALPAVLIASVVMLTVLLAAVSSTVAIRTALNIQYYNKLAADAADAGAAYAAACIASGGSWSGKVLTPNTNCSGTDIGVSKYIYESSSFRLSFEVGGTDADGNDLSDLASANVSGKIELLKNSDGAVWRRYSSDTNVSMAATNNVVVVPGSPYMQDITATSCTIDRTQVQDARDGHSYWMQRLADGKCWMLTNLGYAGDGTGTYSDTKTLTQGVKTYTTASYYPYDSTILSGISTVNFTEESTNPSSATNGAGQFGYLYNWCAATGGGGCDILISICPSSWRLPTSNEFSALDSNSLLTTWLGQHGGYWGDDNSSYHSYKGEYGMTGSGFYWSNDSYSNTEAYYFSFSTSVGSLYITTKNHGLAVRCVLN